MKTVSSDNLARFKAKCDETYQKKGSGGGIGSVEYATNDEIDTLFSADELVGEWSFNFDNYSEIIPSTISSDIVYNFEFVSYGETFNSLRQKRVAYGTIDGISIQYDDKTVFTTDPHGWPQSEVPSKGTYRTITIVDVSNLTNPEEFATWLKANATKQ